MAFNQFVHDARQPRRFPNIRAALKIGAALGFLVNLTMPLEVRFRLGRTEIYRAVWLARYCWAVRVAWRPSVNQNSNPRKEIKVVHPRPPCFRCMPSVDRCIVEEVTPLAHGLQVVPLIVVGGMVEVRDCQDDG